MKKNQPLISIITTCYTSDRFNDITELLSSIYNQTYDNLETIIVIERSPELFHKVEAYITENHFLNVRTIFNGGEWGLSTSRNLGIENAEGDIVAFVDDDATLNSSWAEATTRAYLEDSSLIGVTGPILPLWENESLSWFPKEFYWMFSCTYYDWQQNRSVRNGYGTNISFRKEAFGLCGLFLHVLGAKGGGESGKHELGNEETEFSYRVRRMTGKQIMYIPEVIVNHKVNKYRFTVKFITRRAYWEGYTKAVLKKYLSNQKTEEKFLSTEYELFRDIIFKLFPDIFMEFFKRPMMSLHKFLLTVAILFHVGLGYLVATLRCLISKSQLSNTEILR